MVDVSAAWKEIHKGDLLPETFVEVTCSITEMGAQQTATTEGGNEAYFSSSWMVAGNSWQTVVAKYATLEQNLWSLDGSRNFLSGFSPYRNTGYVSADSSLGRVTLTTSPVRQSPVAGVTIVWSTEFNEYPTRFSVTAKNGSTVIASTTVEGNTSTTSIVDLPINNYNTIVVDVLDWCLPNRRFRVERIYLGHILTFTKNELLSYSHEQSGNINSAELPKNSIEFSVDNTDGRWNPNNPNGVERYLSERQPVTVRYGMDVNGTTEWIRGGSFYLSEWKAPSNGMEASFVARDALEFLMNEEYPAYEDANLQDVLEHAYSSGSPEIANYQMRIDYFAGDWSCNIPEGYSRAEVIQMGANAACCPLRFDRDGTLNIERLYKNPTDYVISAAQSYSYPETTLSKPLKNVTVSYGDGNSYVLQVGTVGESQTVENPVVLHSAQAEYIALWVKDVLESRKTVSGEFRADPRLDLFDRVSVEGKYGVIEPVYIEYIKYTYNGSFKATYTGRVIPNTGEILP